MRKNLLSVVLLLLIVFQLSAISSRYVFNTLDENDKKLYLLMDEAILSCDTTIDATGYSKEDCLRIMSDYLDDHPGVFWVDGKIDYTTSMSQNGKIVHGVRFYYTHQSSLNSDKVAFVNLVNRFHNYIKDDENDWFKLFHIYDYLASTIVYNNNYMDQSMWSVFFNGVGVCAGFARSFQYLALLEGIPCIIVTGYEKDENGNPGPVRHAWCMAQIEGNWYHFDPTWGVKDLNGNVDYTYFCRSDERIEKTHIIDTKYPLPKSLDDNLSYVRVRNRFLETYSFNAVKEIARTAFRRGERLFTIEFKSKSSLEKAINELVEKNDISKILKELNVSISTYKYSFNLKSCALTLSFSP